MRPIGRPRKVGKLRHPFAGLLARRGITVSRLVAMGILPRTAASWVRGERVPMNAELILAALDR